ncbi:hypothetical protein M427DRAFT_65508 [Gonapodya prolifera JEL478]|uniref:Uncharacterized protein n=1 Tax=Gonapodya prolifera (strain JEL478) TaxID=1344416 RepID=A0A139AYC3_GONPJ|nr:hypothetical protein M427DRAFT_65508 [Gonapodya prolifera JEL478]|eukprot:KXS21445.1 hypothetical protein M427DRAFT_65508 [Gonapodya prolifera JEL478]
MSTHYDDEEEESYRADSTRFGEEDDADREYPPQTHDSRERFSQPSIRKNPLSTAAARPATLPSSTGGKTGVDRKPVATPSQWIRSVIEMGTVLVQESDELKRQLANLAGASGGSASFAPSANATSDSLSSGAASDVGELLASEHQRVAQLQKELDNLSTEFTQVKLRHDQLLADLESAREELEQAKENGTSASGKRGGSSRDEDEDDGRDGVEELSELRRAHEDLTSAHDELKEKFSELTARYEELERGSSNGNKDASEDDDYGSEKRGKRSEDDSDMDALREELSSLREAHESTKSELERANEELARLRDSDDERGTDRDNSAPTGRDVGHEEVESLREELSALRESRDFTKSELERVTEQLEKLREEGNGAGNQRNHGDEDDSETSFAKGGDEELESLREELEKAREELSQAREEMEQLREQSRTSSDGRHDDDEDNERSQSGAHNREEVESLRAELDKAREELAGAREEIERLRDRSQANSGGEDDDEDSKTGVESLRSEQEKAREEIEQLRERSHDSSDGDRDESDSDHVDGSEVARLRAELEEARGQVSQLKEEVEELKSGAGAGESDSRSERDSGFGGSEEDSDDAADETKRELESLKKELEDVRAENERLKMREEQSGRGGADEMDEDNESRHREQEDHGVTSSTTSNNDLEVLAQLRSARDELETRVASLQSEVSSLQATASTSNHAADDTDAEDADVGTLRDTVASLTAELEEARRRNAALSIAVRREVGWRVEREEKRFQEKRKKAEQEDKSRNFLRRWMHPRAKI